MWLACLSSLPEFVHYICLASGLVTDKLLRSSFAQRISIGRLRMPPYARPNFISLLNSVYAALVPRNTPTNAKITWLGRGHVAFADMMVCRPHHTTSIRLYPHSGTRSTSLTIRAGGAWQPSNCLTMLKYLQRAYPLGAGMHLLCRGAAGCSGRMSLRSTSLTIETGRAWQPPICPAML